VKKQMIRKIQEFLTIVGEDRTYQIVNVEILLKRHPPEAVVALLIELRKDYKRELKTILDSNRTDPRLNEIVAKNFRLKMAINTIRNEKRRPTNG
jgi:hypothetical protein